MRFIFVTLLLTVGWVEAAPAKISVVTTTTDLAWSAKRIGGKLVEAEALLAPNQNPHFLDARPSFIRKVAEADIVCQIGMSLEIGWLPRVFERSGNPDVQTGGKGFCDTGAAIRAIDVPKGQIDRSMGDVHPSGNPHFWLSPLAFSDASSVIRDALIRVDPANQTAYQEKHRSLKSELTKLHQENTQRLKKAFKSEPLVIQYHEEFNYFFKAYPVKNYGSIEEKPGVPPSAGRIARVAQAAKAAGVQLVLATPYTPRGPLEKFQELSGIPVVTLPTSVSRPGKELSDYNHLQKHLVNRIIEVIKNKNTE